MNNITTLNKNRIDEFEIPEFIKNIQETKNKKAKADFKKQGEETIFNPEFCKYVVNKEDGGYKLVPKKMQENVFTIMRRYETTSKYNEMLKDLEINTPFNDYSQDNKAELGLNYILNKCIHHDFNASKDLVCASLLEQGERNKYNPVKDWINNSYSEYKNSCLDELTEFKKLSNTLVTPKTFKKEYKDRLLKTWLVSCVKAVFDTKGIASQGILILQGIQGLMKTTWLKKIVPNEEWFREGYTLDPSDKDSVLGAIKYWIVELGEIESSFKKDVNKLKAYITSDSDEVRRPYARGMSKYPRRTIFCGSVNGEEFLKDATGNRRYWVIPCEEIKFNDDLDLKKLWAEIYQMYLDGGRHYLNKEETQELNNINASYEEKDHVYTMIECSFDWDSPSRYWLKAKDVYNLLGNTSKIKSTTQISKNLIKMGVETRKSAGTTQYSVGKAINVLNWRFKDAPEDESKIYDK